MFGVIALLAVGVFVVAFFAFAETGTGAKVAGALLPLLVVGGAGAAVVAGIVWISLPAFVDERDQSTAAATSWAQSLGYTSVVVNCANRDSNSDGYVSCTVAGTKDGKAEVFPVECARTVSMNDGCRMQRWGGAR